MNIVTREQFRHPVARFTDGSDDRVEARERAMERLDDSDDRFESAVIVPHEHGDECREHARDEGLSVEEICPPDRLLDLLVTYTRIWED